MAIDFAGKVAIVTGAGNGIGRAYALELARRGARVVVNDLGSARDGTGHSDAARAVVAEIEAAGGEAMANGASVTEYAQMEAMVAEVRDRWGSVHILINNAGILRDRTFAKMEPADFELVVRVHLLGTAYATHAVWPLMREQEYGRVLMTSSSSGLATRMTEDIFPEEAFNAFTPESVAAAAAFLVSENAPQNVMMGAGGGVYQCFWLTMNQGVLLPPEQRTAEGIAAAWKEISDRSSDAPLAYGMEQQTHAMELLTRAAKD